MEEELVLQNAENGLGRQINGLKTRRCGILIWMNCLSFRYKTRTVCSPKSVARVATLCKPDSLERFARTSTNAKTSGHTFPWRSFSRYILESMLLRMYLSYNKENMKKKNLFFFGQSKKWQWQHETELFQGSTLTGHCECKCGRVKRWFAFENEIENVTKKR